MKIEVVKGDIFEQNVDAIVNPANEWMIHSGGLARVISCRAGQELDVASAEQAPVATGLAIITPPGKLPFHAVIHTVGPVYSRYLPVEADGLLFSAYISAMITANIHNMKSIAFPAVSCGIFGFPVHRAAPQAILAAKSYNDIHPDTNIARVVFVLPADLEYKAFRKALRGWKFWRR